MNNVKTEQNTYGGRAYKLIFFFKTKIDIAQSKSLHLALDFSASASTLMGCVDIPLSHTLSPNAWWFCVIVHAPPSTALSTARGIRSPWWSAEGCPASGTPCTTWFPLTGDRSVATWKGLLFFPPLRPQSPRAHCSSGPARTAQSFLFCGVHDEAVGFLSENQTQVAPQAPSPVGAPPPLGAWL